MDLFQVIAEPKRRRILQLIWDEEKRATEIADRFDVTFGAISQHLRVLRDKGLVTVRKDGTKRFYQADRQRLEPFRDILESMWGETLSQLSDVIEQDQT